MSRLSCGMKNTLAEAWTQAHANTPPTAVQQPEMTLDCHSVTA